MGIVASRFTTILVITTEMCPYDRNALFLLVASVDFLFAIMEPVALQSMRGA